MNTPRSDKEKIWLEEYLKTFNAAEAARRANYAHPRQQGWRKKEKFKELIERRLDEMVMEANEVLREMSEIARGAYAYYFREDGSLDVEQMIKDGKGHLIKGVRETKYGKRFELVDRERQLENLAREHGLFKTVHQGPDGGPVQIRVVETNIDEGDV